MKGYKSGYELARPLFGPNLKIVWMILALSDAKN